MNHSNPLLNAGALPAFDAIRPEHVGPAIDTLLAQAEAALEAAVSEQTPAEYEALSRVLSVPTERLGRAWGAVGHLKGVMDTPELRAAFNDKLPAITDFYTRLGADERLYAKYKAVAASPAAAQLNKARQQELKHSLRDFVLGGAELQGEAKTRHAQIQEEQALLSQKFSEHVLDATDGYALFVSTDELAGVPADVLSATRAAAEKDGRDGHKLTLHMPAYLPVMQYADDRTVRECLYTAYVTRACETGPAERDNSAVMADILRLRHEEAALLGYANYAELSLVPKMAHDPKQVTDFLRDLARRARPFAERDLAELREFAARELGLADLQSWDSAYASEKLKEARYAFSDQAVKQYFTEPKVLAGLFRIIETLFEVAIRPDSAPVWHESVRFYRIERAGALVGQFYLDPYARPGKRPGAWMDDVRGRWLRPDDGQLQTPVAHLVCNFTAPADGKPALLTHDEVQTLFHEFGHGLHHMLTQVDELGVSGISGVEWDAVELPSQFMENFCWEWEVLQQLTAHIDSGEPLPRELFDKMTAAKNFQSGMQTLRQVEFSLFDMLLHAEPGAAGRIQQVVDAVRNEVAVMKPPAFNRFQHTFSHIFAGGYAAGYYSYKWAEVLSADAWGAFEEEGLFNADTGRRYRQEILEAGSARDAIDNFKAFRGREPSIDALLRHQGMAA
ncbi:Oligopeptidase A [Leptothrix cholodnii SP-6]|uniref:oligopeptidase A n=1 Tax=Leptothrix cholodnii (strain ATCC 51168 / LMG 8142 / SP-6) TaxID=395495 RepID=B1XXC8_LEPCP|nr:M3 family metallopeptidase [Leptothrix cholodnii]ACB33909.1 Oligopeptidase A [Leptothrix cholodnii SP-6]